MFSDGQCIFDIDIKRLLLPLLPTPHLSTSIPQSLSKCSPWCLQMWSFPSSILTLNLISSINNRHCIAILAQSICGAGSDCYTLMDAWCKDWLLTIVSALTDMCSPSRVVLHIVVCVVMVVHLTVNRWTPTPKGTTTNSLEFYHMLCPNTVSIASQNKIYLQMVQLK